MTLTKKEMTYQLNILQKAVDTLIDAIEHDDKSTIYRDGILQRFEYSTELARKTGKKFLEYKWITNISFPKDVFKNLHEMKVIPNITIWIDFIDFRNKISHVYSSYQVEEIYIYIKKNYQEFSNLIKHLHVLLAQ